MDMIAMTLRLCFVSTFDVLLVASAPDLNELMPITLYLGVMGSFGVAKNV